MVPEELTELLELGQECIAEEEVREKETAAEKELPRKVSEKFSSRFCRPFNKLLKLFEDMNPNT